MDPQKIEPVEDRAAFFSSERAKAFVDAVVAIAMTLLILPLMESATQLGEERSDGRTPGLLPWLADHEQQLMSFLISFVVIAMFWIRHHRLFSRVERVTQALLWLLMPWLACIVWLPIATALSGQVDSSDPLVKAVYIGSMALTCVGSIVVRWYVARHPEIHGWGGIELRNGLCGDVAMLIIFCAAALLAVLLPGVGYYAQLLLFLTPFLARGLRRLAGSRVPPQGTAVAE